MQRDVRLTQFHSLLDLSMAQTIWPSELATARASRVSGYLSYLAEDADLDVAASDMNLVRVT